MTEFKRRAKIVATIGPASQDKTTLEKMIRAGMNVARLNFSHGDHEIHAATTQLLREISSEMDVPLAIMQDLQGVKIRTGELAEPVLLTPGETAIFTTASDPAPNHIPVDFPDLHKYLKPAETILVDDGSMELTIDKVEGRIIYATVKVGGLLKSH
ncbi:MAG TPA: pyruvate kinase, partial [Anaerolineales bacterium]|nr:pyruvate kinase [Anaerolineales bacterium]